MIRGSSYEDLLLSYAPRTIQNESQYKQAVIHVSSLLEIQMLTSAEKELLLLLTTLIQAYEEQHYPAETFESCGIELLNGLMELHGLRQVDLLPIFKTRSIASTVLSGKRRLTVEHINRLAHFFKLPHRVFFDPIQSPVYT